MADLRLVTAVGEVKEDFSSNTLTYISSLQGKVNPGTALSLAASRSL